MTNLPTEDGRAGPTALEDMVERVARAILAGHDWTERIGWEGLSPAWRGAYRNMARAAIEAMREIPVSVINRCHMEPTQHGFEYWEAIIDAALQGTEGPGSPTLPQEEQRGG